MRPTLDAISTYYTVREDIPNELLTSSVATSRATKLKSG